MYFFLMNIRPDSIIENTLADIADQFNLSSLSYFTRFVQKYLGANPMDFRE